MQNLLIKKKKKKSCKISGWQHLKHHATSMFALPKFVELKDPLVSWQILCCYLNQQ